MIKRWCLTPILINVNVFRCPQKRDSVFSDNHKTDVEKICVFETLLYSAQLFIVSYKTILIILRKNHLLKLERFLIEISSFTKYRYRTENWEVSSIVLKYRESLSVHHYIKYINEVTEVMLSRSNNPIWLHVKTDSRMWNEADCYCGPTSIPVILYSSLK